MTDFHCHCREDIGYLCPLHKAPSKEWCIRMAKLEGVTEIGAGAPDHPLRVQPTAMPPKVEAPAADEVRGPSVVYDVAMPPMAGTQPQADAVAVEPTSSSSWVYEIQYGPEGESNYAHVFASDGRLIAVMKVSDAAKIAAIRSGGAS